MRLVLFATAALSVVALSARPTEAATIDFNTLSGSNGTAFTSYTENGFTVTATSGTVSVGGFYGNPVPDLVFDFNYDPSGSSAVSVTGSGAFQFVSVDLSSGSSDPTQFSTYTIAGFLGSQSVFSQSGSLPGSATNAFVTVGAMAGNATIDRLSITQGGGGSSLSANLDNVVVQAAASTVPEPASASLVGAALLGAGLLLRRARARS